MREILKTVLSEGKKVAAAPGSYNTPLGIAKFVETLDGDEDVLIFELGEYYPGDVRTLCEFVEPKWGVITGVNEAHLEKFGTLDKTAATVFELADYVGIQPLYVNGENVSARERAPQTAVLYSREGVDEWRVTDAHTGLSGTRFMLRKGPLAVSVHSELLGMHAVGPIAAAVHMALALGLTVAQIEEGVRRTKAFDHRLEPKTDGSGVVTLDDSYNGNPDGVAAVIDFLASLKGRRFYVTPGLVEMGDRTEEVHRDIGKRLAHAGIEQVVLIRNSVTPSIEAGLTEAGYSGTVTWFDDALDAYGALPHMTVAGDIVLLQNDWPDQYN
jgi:UDP-N-acetylmuramoyl-tripeptide--D-alanyl-D-alanine ligase